MYSYPSLMLRSCVCSQITMRRQVGHIDSDVDDDIDDDNDDDEYHDDDIDDEC